MWSIQNQWQIEICSFKLVYLCPREVESELIFSATEIRSAGEYLGFNAEFWDISKRSYSGPVTHSYPEVAGSKIYCPDRFWIFYPSNNRVNQKLTYLHIQWIYNRSKSRYKSHPLLNINTNGYQTVSGFVLCSSEQGYERSQYGMHIIWEVSESRCSVIPTDSFRRKANLDRVQTRHILPNLEYDFYEY